MGVGIQPEGVVASVTPSPSDSSYSRRNFLRGKAISTVASGPEACLEEQRCTQMSKGKNTVNLHTCDMCLGLGQTQTLSCKKKWDSCFIAKCQRNVFPLQVPTGSISKEQNDHEVLHPQIHTCWSLRWGERGLGLKSWGQVLGPSCSP